MFNPSMLPALCKRDVTQTSVGLNDTTAEAACFWGLQTKQQSSQCWFFLFSSWTELTTIRDAKAHARVSLMRR